MVTPLIALVCLVAAAFVVRAKRRRPSVYVPMIRLRPLARLRNAEE
ncbi:MAG: hypothetical protein ABI780_01855 [Ardenticatenales bacterium]